MTTSGDAHSYDSPRLLLSSKPLMLSKALSSGHRQENPDTQSVSYSEKSAIAQGRSATASQKQSKILSPGSGLSTPTQSLYERSRSRDARLPAPVAPAVETDVSKDIILQAFLPRVAVYASADTEELIRLKGIYGGFRGLLRPFGEKIQGRVVIRDSVGASKNCENFGIHFIKLGEKPESLTTYDIRDDKRGAAEESNYLKSSSVTATTSGTISVAIEEVVDRYMRDEDLRYTNTNRERSAFPTVLQHTRRESLSYYTLYLRKLLSSMPMVPHETFSQPVACIIAISSQSLAPIETLRDLYSDTRQGDKSVPSWAGDEYLRYYVLIHDEEHDDITRSTALFEQMKRHFGLHCHLLRIRSTECVPTDDDSIKFPACEWLTAEEELIHLRRQDQDVGDEDFQQYLFESDAAAVRTFLREMVTQSIVPFMEGRVTAWNDQVASRRRGISGRFMSISKRWTGFGSTRGSLSGSGDATSSSGSNYDIVHACYPPETPEATMRRLADYAFMLRDWKLSYSTYDLLRTDFGNDKAWRYYAAANEMAAISLLLTAQSSTLKSREILDQMINAASYSYITRCASPDGAIRCLLLSVELLRNYGGSASEDAAKWAARLLELTIMSPVAQNLLVERIAGCYKLQPGLGQSKWGSRDRKTAFWTLLASDAFLSLDLPAKAHSSLQEARSLYCLDGDSGERFPFINMRNFWENLEREVAKRSNDSQYSVIPGDALIDRNPAMDEESEQLDAHAHAHRRSLSGAVLMGSQSHQAGGLNRLMQEKGYTGNEDDEFV